MRPRALTGLLTTITLTGLAVTACAGGSRATLSHEVQPEAPLPRAVTAFLDEVAEPGRATFSATYEVLQKLGGTTSAVRVVSSPPSWRIEVDDLIVVAGGLEATCHAATRTCDRRVREEQLAQYGIFSRFYSSGPAEALRSAAKRVGAGRPERTNRSVAGVELDCLTIPIGAAPTSVACLTPEGVFGLVDDVSKRIALTAYSTADPPPVTLPYPLS